MSDSTMLIQNDSEWDLFCRKKSEAEPFILHTTMAYIRKNPKCGTPGDGYIALHSRLR
jgi:hypothetical protein